MSKYAPDAPSDEEPPAGPDMVAFLCGQCSRKMSAALDKVGLAVACDHCGTSNVVPMPRIGMHMGRRPAERPPQRAAAKEAFDEGRRAEAPAGATQHRPETRGGREPEAVDEKPRSYTGVLVLLACLGLGIGWAVTQMAPDSSRPDPQAEAVVLSTLKIIRDKRESARMGLEDITRNLQPRLEAALENNVSPAVTGQLSDIIDQVRAEAVQRWGEIQGEQMMLLQRWQEHPLSYEEALRKAAAERNLPPAINDIAGKFLEHTQRLATQESVEKMEAQVEESSREFLKSILPEAEDYFNFNHPPTHK